MPWRHLARTLIVPACCLVLNLVVFWWARLPPRAALPAWQQLSSAALIVAAACAVTLLALPTGAALTLLLSRFAQSGRVNAFTACRVSYYLAAELASFLGVVLWAAYVATVGAWGQAPPLILAALAVASIAAMAVLGGRMTLLLGMALGVVVWDAYGPTAILRGIAPPLWILGWLAASAASALRSPSSVMRTNAGEVTRLWGRAIPLGRVPSLRAFLEPLARPMGFTLPEHLVVGLGPGIALIPRDVVVNEEVLEGATVYLSLPMCRVMDRGELAGLVAFEMVHARLYPAWWKRFIQTARASTSHFLGHRLPGGMLRATLAASYVPLELWTEIWARLDVDVWLEAVRRGAVVSGRETAASALSKDVLYPAAWPPFISELRQRVSEATDESFLEDNISRRLAERLLGLPKQPEFLRPFESAEALERDQPALAAIAATLGVERAAIAMRLHGAPLDPAIDLIDGAAEFERELSAQALREIWSHQPGWSPGSVAATDATAPPRPANADIERRLATPEARPYAVREGMFVLAHKDRSVEGVVLGVAGLAFVLMVAWTFSQPLIHRVFPEFGATKAGPKGFPVTVHIGDGDLTFTNGSGQDWSCQVEVGFPRSSGSYTCTFLLEAHKTRHVSYQAFDGRDTVTDARDVREKAHAGGTLDCVERSGTSHFWGW